MANGILTDQLQSSDLGLKGQTPGIRAGALDTSTLHFQSSINNMPEIDRPASNLDLDGKTPAKYTNPETGATY